MLNKAKSPDKYDICRISKAGKIIFKMWWDFVFEDTGRTFNINMHSAGCFAWTRKEAITKIEQLRPDLKGRNVTSAKPEKQYYITHTQAN